MRTGTAVGLDAQAVKWVRVRVGLLAVAFMPAFFTLAHRAFQLQVTEGTRMVQLAQEQYLEEAQIPPRRGVIYDRNGVPLAATVDVDSLSADPAQLPAGSAGRAALAAATGIDLHELDLRLAKGHHFAWVKRGLSAAEGASLRAANLPGVSFVKEPRRFYPQRELAANVLGFAGVDGEGLEGVELAFNDQLKGKSQNVDFIRDAQRRTVFAEGVADTDELAGASVTLTLDRGIQHIAESAVADVEKKSSGKSAMAVVMDPATGEILAMATAPTFNPNDPSRFDPGATRNRVVADAFEPGSTFKAFSMAAALEEKVVKPTDPIFCENGHYAIGTRTLHDAESRGSGWIPATKVITVSSNIGAAKIGEKLGREKLLSYYRKFGFGEKPSIGLPGEVRGSLPYPKAEIQLATESFGQGLTASALQLTAAYGAIANGGVLMKPFLVKKIVDPDGALLESHGPEVERQVVSATTAQQLTAMLETVVTKEGTAPKAAMDDYAVAGKTGTAQKADPETGGYSADRRTASFIGFVPADAPRLVIAVIIDEPQGDKYGGLVAAPAFKAIAEQALPLLGVAPRHTAALVATVDPAPGTKLRADAPPVGEDDEALPDAPDGSMVAAGHAQVPDLTGLAAREAARVLAQAELEPTFRGSGQVVKQSPPAGAVVARGTRVALQFDTLH